MLVKYIRNQCNKCHFEQTEVWTPALEEAFVDAAAQILRPYEQTHSHPNELYFPVYTLIEELEDIACALSVAGCPMGKGWVARLLCGRLHVSTALVCANYLQLLEKCVGQRPDKIVQVICSVAYVVLHWVNGVYRYSP
jgi:hypothetical protein